MLFYCILGVLSVKVLFPLSKVSSVNSSLFSNEFSLSRIVNPPYVNFARNGGLDSCLEFLLTDFSTGLLNSAGIVLDVDLLSK